MLMLPSSDVWEQEADRPKGTAGDDQLGVDGEHCRPYVAGRVLLRSLTQQLEDSWNLSDNYLISSIAVWCASAVVCDADDDLLAEHAETPTADADLDPSFAKLCQRLRFRLESCLPRKGNVVESFPATLFKRPNSKLGLHSISQGSHYAQISVETVAADMELSTDTDGIAMPDEDSDIEAAVQPAVSSSDVRCGQETTLSSEAIVQWMRGCTPAASESYGGTSTESTSTTASSIQASTSFSALSLAVSFKSQGIGGRARLLLDNSINAIALLRHAMQLSKYVMVVQLAGASGVCRAVVKSLANLASRIPTSMLSIQVVCMPGLRGLSRKLTGLATLPSLAHNKRTCPWSSLFKSSQVPRASLFASASGRVVCEDALQEVQKLDAAQTFPWTSSTWPDCLHNAILKQVNGGLTADELVRKPVVLIHVQTSSERPLGFTELLAMWIAMYVPKNALCCYTSPDGEQLRRCGHLLFLDQKALIAAQDEREGGNCCMLLSPVHRHLLMVVDLQALGANSPAWSIPDCTLQSAVHDLGTLMFKRLHTTRALIMMSLCKDEDAELRSTFDEAVQLLYSPEPQGPQVQVAQGIEPVMYCFVPYSSPSTPAAVKHFLEDAVSRFSEPEDVCVILSVSVPNMMVSEITCQQVPELDYICGVVESHFQRDLAVHHLVRRRPLFS